MKKNEILHNKIITTMTQKLEQAGLDGQLGQEILNYLKQTLNTHLSIENDIKYKIVFNTDNFQSKNRRNWERQLYNDWTKAVNHFELFCKSDKELLNELNYIVGRKIKKDRHNFILQNKKYGQREMSYKLPGFCQGYVDFDKIIEELKNKSRYTINFNSFYDIRQGNFFKGCHIYIFRLNGDEANE